jgi:hypothetical protein
MNTEQRVIVALNIAAMIVVVAMLVWCSGLCKSTGRAPAKER